jgi:hypothetical protein
MPADGFAWLFVPPCANCAKRGLRPPMSTS